MGPEAPTSASRRAKASAVTMEPLTAPIAPPGKASKCDEAIGLLVEPFLIPILETITSISELRCQIRSANGTIQRKELMRGESGREGKESKCKLHNTGSERHVCQL